MADKRKGKKRKEEVTHEEPEKPIKEEYSVAKWLRKNVPTKKTKFLNHNVEYFTASKAIDSLMASHWAVPANEGEEPFFPSRVDVVEFMDVMLRHKFFHRAKKVPVTEQELKAKLKKKDKKVKEEPENSHVETEKKEKPAIQGAEEKRKRKIRLEMHLEQLFSDGLDAYVWIYDPIPICYWFIGMLLVLGAIAICLFPLWPHSVRKGVYYLSVASAGALIVIIGLALLRVVVFSIIWAATFGCHHFWLLPNLTEDVGFLPSFWPLYKYEYKGSKPSGKRHKRDKDSDNEDQDEDRSGGEEKDEGQDVPPGADSGKEEVANGSESESESSQKSQTGRDFEMVEREEVES